MSNLADIFKGSISNKSQVKMWEEMERGRIQGLPKFFEYPLLSQDRIKLRTSNLAGIFTGSIRTKALKILGENEACAYPGTAQIFWVPLLSQERVKLRTSNFVRTFLVSIGTNITNFWKSSRVRSKDSKNFQGTHILGASRGLLCDSWAVLSRFLLETMHLSFLILKHLLDFLLTSATGVRKNIWAQ